MQIVEITKQNIEKIEMFLEVSEGKLRHLFEPQGGVFIAESPMVILAALDAGMEPLALLVPSNDITGSAAEIIKRVGHIPIFSAGEKVLANLRGFSLIRGAMCAMRRPTLMGEEQILKKCSRIAVLDHVQNPTNVGATMRSAAALGMDAVLLTEDCSDPLYRRAARVSMGTVFQIPWTYLAGAGEHYVSRLQQMGFTTVAMALSDSALRLDDPKLKKAQKLAVILGSEGYGLPAKTVLKCDYTVKIPMHYGVDSLNVAAASAVAFWQLGERA